MAAANQPPKHTPPNPNPVCPRPALLPPSTCDEDKQPRGDPAQSKCQAPAKTRRPPRTRASPSGQISRPQRRKPAAGPSAEIQRSDEVELNVTRGVDPERAQPAHGGGSRHAAGIGGRGAAALLRRRRARRGHECHDPSAGRASARAGDGARKSPAVRGRVAPLKPKQSRRRAEHHGGATCECARRSSEERCDSRDAAGLVQAADCSPSTPHTNRTTSSQRTV